MILSSMGRKVSDSSSSGSSNSDSSEDSLKMVSILVQNLSPNVTQDHVNEIFAHFGHIRSCGLRRLKNYAIVNYGTQEEADAAILAMNQAYIDGLTVTVNIENTRDEDER